MASMKQLAANRRNAQLSTGPITPEGKQRSRFNALVHGMRAETTVLPDEPQEEFDKHLAGITESWKPQNDFETKQVNDIAALQWKLARLDGYDYEISQSEMDIGQRIAALHRLYLAASRLRRDIAAAVVTLKKIRLERIEREKEEAEKRPHTFQGGLIWNEGNGVKHYTVLPKVRGVDDVWRQIPYEVLGDIPPEERMAAIPEQLRPTVITGGPPTRE